MEEAGRGKRSDENSARGAPRGTGVPVRNKYSRGESGGVITSATGLFVKCSVS